MKLQDWQAALIGYGIFLLMAETTLGGLAVIAAWGIAITEILSVASGGQGVLQNLVPSLPATGSQSIPNQQATAAQIQQQPIFQTPGQPQILGP